MKTLRAVYRQKIFVVKADIGALCGGGQGDLASFCVGEVDFSLRDVAKSSHAVSIQMRRGNMIDIPLRLIVML